jgi:hypothetical protein
MAVMLPTNPLFYVSTVVQRVPSGVPPPASDLASAVFAMQEACYGPEGFRDLPCSTLSSVVGRMAADIPSAASTRAPPTPSLAQQVAALDAKRAVDAHITAALATLGRPPIRNAVLCGSGGASGLSVTY